MKLLVIGTLAFDSVETPYDKREQALGGSATYFAYAASFFGPVRMVGVVGEDFPDDVLEGFRGRGIDTEGIEVAAGKSFAWGGRYEADWNTRHTLFTDLNVFADFDPKVPEGHRDSEFLFLANGAPAIQMAALDQCTGPKMVVADTMNLWIDQTRDDLEKLVKRVDGLVLNDEEAQMLTGNRSMLHAAREILEMGPRFVILKKGEHGAFLLGQDVHFALPAYPVERVVDPTGAGDSFAGGFMGYLAYRGNTDAATLRQAMVYGTVTASYCVQDFSIDELAARSRASVEDRCNDLRAFVTP